jgi:hypothetical protein
MIGVEPELVHGVDVQIRCIQDSFDRRRRRGLKADAEASRGMFELERGAT